MLQKLGLKNLPPQLRWALILIAIILPFGIALVGLLLLLWKRKHTPKH